MSRTALLPLVERALWRAGLSPRRLAEGAHRLLGVAEYPAWRLRCHQTRRWYLGALFEDLLAESPDPTSFLALITVDRRDEGAVATFPWALLEAWLAGERPPVVPRRRPRRGYAHHALLAEIVAAGRSGEECLPLLVSRQLGKPWLCSVPLATFRDWLEAFPAPRPSSQEEGEQMALALWPGRG